MHSILQKMFLFFSMLSLCSFFRLKESFQVKNGLTTSSFFFFFLKMLRIWVGRTTLNEGKKEDGLIAEGLYANGPHYLCLQIKGLVK